MAFENISGFGAGDAESLYKAMVAGNITGRETDGQNLTLEPLKLESLDATVRLLNFRERDVKLWNYVPKIQVYNTVSEHNLLVDYGSDRGGFYDEGELSDVEDSTYRRESAIVKYIQVTGEVTTQAQMVNTNIGNVLQSEVQNKVKWVMRRANTFMTKGNSAHIGQQWDGLYKQHERIGEDFATIGEYIDSSTVIDLRGAQLTQKDIEAGSVIVDDNFGALTHFWAPPSVLSGLTTDYYDKQRILLSAPSTGLNTFDGSAVPPYISTTMGQVTLMSDKFMKKTNTSGLLLSASATSTKAPTAPTTVDAVLTVGGDAQSKFTTAEGGLGTVYYAVTALNRYGESSPTLDATAITLTDGESVDITITPAGGANPATAFVVYRSLVTASSNPLADGVKFFPLFTVSNTERVAGYDGGAAGVVRDRNRWLPNTEEGFGAEMSQEVLGFKQLAPISKLDLARASLSSRFITFLFGTPVLFAPRKMIRYINVGKITGVDI